MKRHLQCAEQQKAASNFSKYCACHRKWMSWLIRIAYETSFTMRGATGITLQLHQILRLPRKMNLMIDPHRIWNVIYNAQSKSHHPSTSPNTAPATQNERHDWSASHMKRHLQCAEQQASPSNLTKYCASHAKWTSWLIRITYATSFTMRGATGITLQPHQILRQPRKMNLMIDPHRICNVIYNARSNRHHPPTSPNTAPAMQNASHDWSASHMKRHLQCAEQQASPSNFTKYCACHAKWMSWLIVLTYETSFTMRGATGISFQPQQILRLPRKRNVMIDPHHIWNVIYNARSDRHQPPTSPNTAPATQNCTRKSLRHVLKTAEVAFPMRDRSETVPRMIREWSDPENAKLNPPRRQGYFSHWPGADSIENYNVSRPAYHSKFHHMLRLPRKVTHELHQMLRLPRKVTHELHQILHLPQKVTHELHQMLRLPRKMTHELHQMLHLPQKVRHELHQMLRLPRKVTHELQQMLHLPQKVTHELHQMLHLPHKVKHNLHQMLHLPATTTTTTTPTTPTTTRTTTYCYDYYYYYYHYYYHYYYCYYYYYSYYYSYYYYS